jgi:hypothetical protein
MKWIPALIKPWLRNQYWKIYSLPIWDILSQIYEERFMKKQSYEVDGNEYNHLFISPRTSYNLFIDSRIWNQILGRLPEGYTLPGRASLQVLQPMTADYYGSLFPNPLPMYGIFVDGSVWQRIKASVPEEYAVPDLNTTEILKTMTADHYNTLFAAPVSTLGIVVDGQIWKRITSSVTPGYRIPDSLTIDTLNKVTLAKVGK